MKKIFCLAFILVMLLNCGCSKFVILPQQDSGLADLYANACDELKEGNLEQAYQLFSQLGEYKDSEYHLSKFAYLPTNTVTADTGMGEEIAYYNTDYTYNEYGELLTVKGAYTKDEGPGFEEKHEYNEKGLMIKSETTSEAGFSTITYEYDQNGLLTKRIGCTDGANVGGITYYTYNDQYLCTLTKTNSYLGIDTSAYEQQEPYHTENKEYSYTASGLCEKAVETYAGNGSMTYTITYNENGMPLEFSAIDESDYTSKTFFEYDNNGRCIKVTTPYDSTEFIYGDKSYPKQSKRITEGVEPCITKYTYKLFYLRTDKEKIPFHLEQYLSSLEV